MKPAPFSVVRPGSIGEAVAFLAEHGDDARPIAGGQSLVPAMNFRLARPAVLVDLSAIPGLDRIEVGPDALVIGARVPHAAFHTPVCDDALGRLLARVVREIAHLPIRHRGTFGGALAHADPASEWCLVAATLDAAIAAVGPGGERRIAAADFFRGSFTTALGPAELLTAVTLPRLGPGWVAGFREFARRKGDFALAMALVALQLEGGTIRDARVGLGAVGDRPRRYPEIEAALRGRAPSAAAFAAAGDLARGLVSPHDDIHGSGDYRRDLAGAMVERALGEAAGTAP